MSDNVVRIRDAVKDAKPSKKTPRAAKPEPQPPAGGSGGGFYGPPDRLPDDAPVRALGRYGAMYYFLDCKGQFTQLQASEIGRNQILSLFGGSKYLIATWPAYGRDGKPNGEFKHGLLSPVLIESCTALPLFDPAQRLRSLGTWAEEDGTLVFHCGDRLHVAPLGGEPYPQRTGMRGELLYPAAKKTPDPLYAIERDGPYTAAGELYAMLRTWNWKRGETDAKLMFGWICAALLGAAQPWRPMVWVTGDAGTGKSALSTLIEWVLGGTDAMIKSDNATAASIFQLVGRSSLPVVLDEVEAKANNKRTNEIVELARLAASGGALSRGGADGTPLYFVARNCFFFSSILIPTLQPQDISRMAILDLDRIGWEGARKRGELDSEADDEILGRRAEWVKVGQELRGALMREWPRYRVTFASYRRALSEHGHDARGADQFGALGAAFDCAMHSGWDSKRAAAWGKDLAASTLAEARARRSTEFACLHFLLNATLDVHRGGRRQTVSRWLHDCQAIKKGKLDNDNSADTVLQESGIKLYRDKRDEDEKAWWIAVSNTHPEIARIFADTRWQGEAGGTGTWAQALRRIQGSMVGKLRLSKLHHHVTMIPWDVAFPPAQKDDDDEALVALKDRDD